ncbi:hypothetical protein D6T63_13080 [Arthrobacter cheniae]|uniref:DUF624 domain-containing protein n=1 Tax=Arthrobacter cheniae TaxID=1258888 RepID=A0A3A5M2F0_9MICC|nr:hypothetical protein [Arthrobacter cheniae]RJT78438.1 hypothetical protein D6T63_13080 [Arthrobacter cheniae]
MTRRQREAVRDRHAATHDGSSLRWPGATARFALFGEVLWVGVLCCVASLGIVTIPAAFAAGSAHLHRFLRAEDSPLRQFAADFTAALRTGWLAGLGVVLAVGLLLLDIIVANSRLLPGWQVILAAGVVLLAGVLAALAGTTARWPASRSWRAAGRRWLRDARKDPAGVLWLVAAVVLTLMVTWQLPPLVVPGVGCLVFAALATSVRPRR